MSSPFPAYRGQEPFAFVSYACLDKSIVYPVLQRIYDLGARLWYDEGIEPGQHWPNELASVIERCGLVIAFVSKNFVKSEHCRNEVNLAFDIHKDILPIYLEQVVLEDGLMPRLAPIQGIFKYEKDDESFERILLSALSRFWKNLFGKNFGTFQFSNTAELQSWLNTCQVGDKYRFSIGSEGYGSEVLQALEGEITVYIEHYVIQGILELAQHRSRQEAYREVLVDVIDRLGSPGYPEYQWWENNTKNYRGEATITARAGEPASLTITLPEHFRFEWYGW